MATSTTPTTTQLQAQIQALSAQIASMGVQLASVAGGTAGLGLFNTLPLVNVGANADGSIVVNAHDIQVGVITNDQHGARGAKKSDNFTYLHPAATSDTSGFMSGTDKTKLDAATASPTASTLALRDASGGLAIALALTFASTPAASISQSVLAGTGATAGLALSIIGQAGQQQTGGNANNNGGDVSVAAGAAGTGGGGAAGVAGSVLVQASQFKLRDASAGKVAYWTLASAGASSLNWEKGVTPSIAQDSQTTDVACSDLTIASQAPWASATTTKRNPGGIVLALADPTNGQTMAGAGGPAVKVTQNNTRYITFGRRLNNSVSTYGAYWAGTATPDDSNYIFTGDGSSVSDFNTPSGGTLFVTFGGAASGFELTTSQLNFHPSIFTWDIASTTPTIQQANQTANSTAGQPLKIQGQNATGTTSNSGSVTVTTGTATGTVGNLLLQTGGTTRLSIQPAVVQLVASQFQQLRNVATYGTTTVFDYNLGNHQQVTFGAGNITTLTQSNPATGAVYTHVFIQDATGSRTLAVPGTWKTAGSSFVLSTGANKRDSITLLWDGTNYVEQARSMNM